MHKAQHSQIKESAGATEREDVRVSAAEVADIPGSRGTANFCIKWERDAKHAAHLTLIKMAVIRKQYPKLEAGGWTGLIGFECRGLEPTKYRPEVRFALCMLLLLLQALSWHACAGRVCGDQQRRHQVRGRRPVRGGVERVGREEQQLGRDPVPGVQVCAAAMTQEGLGRVCEGWRLVGFCAASSLHSDW